MATRKPAAKKAAAPKKPRRSAAQADKDDNQTFKVNRKDVKEALDAIDQLFDAMATATGTHMEKIKDGYDKYAALLGVKKKNLRKLVKKHRDAMKEQAQEAEMEQHDKDELDSLVLAIGSYKNTPLGRAALEKAERASAAEDMGRP